MVEGAYTQLQIRTTDEKMTETAVEASATFGVSGQTYVFGGLRLAKLRAEDKDLHKLLDELGNGTGIQFGVGTKVVNNVSIEAKYLRTMYTGELESSFEDYSFNGDIEVEASGLAIGVTGTF